MEKAAKITLIVVGSCLGLFLIAFVIIPVLAGVVLITLNPAGQRDRARYTTMDQSVKTISRSLAIAKVEAGKDIVDCTEIASQVPSVKPRTANSCFVANGTDVPEDMQLIYSFNKVTNCAVISTAQKFRIGDDNKTEKYIYYVDPVGSMQAGPTQQSDKLEECK